jgi:hypothetical protein
MAAKSSILSLALAALLGGSAAFILSQLQFSLWIDTSSSQDSAPPVIDVDPVRSSPAVSPTTLAKTVLPEGFRVSNRSAYAVRVVLLSQQTGTKNADPKIDRAPVHWDFAPQEGSQDGLLLSLPSGNLKLASGDVIVAFALDGSRHYWGPYVVGSSDQPKQPTPNSEWQLVLNP